MLEQKDSNITMEYVAKRLNMSVSTVSRAFSRSELVSEDTREKIRQLCQELNYRPNLNARAIACQKTNVVGMIPHNLSKIEQFESLAYNLEQIFHSNGYRLQIELGHSDPEREKGIVESMLDRKVDGIIFGSRVYTGKLDAVETLINSTTPFVIMGYYENEQVSQVAGDFKLAVNALTKHLLDLGHRKIAYLTYAPGDPRIEGHKEAYEGYGLNHSQDLVIKVTPQLSDIREKIDKILSEKFTAILAIHDRVAASIYREFKTMNIRIPEDISVAAVGTGQPSDIWSPPLTVYEMSNDSSAKALSSILLDKINNNSKATRVVMLGGQMIARNSTARI